MMFFPWPYYTVQTLEKQREERQREAELKKKREELKKKVPKNLYVEMPPQTEKTVIEMLSMPQTGSPLNPVTDMSLTQLTLVKLNSGMVIPVLDLSFNK
uniref:Microphthalmia-associated transcription factor n=1 Tax=Caenorhabditis tropicalis TaxID=1561998 RepID=A0A1I7SZK9_9PELO